jgi:uncharacterized protein YbcV (DUF1398 family)
MAAGKPVKEFQQYLCETTNNGVSHTNYYLSPATTFLKYTIKAKNAIDLCVRKFPKNQNGAYSTDSQESIQHLVTAILPTIMGHFETFQKNLFAGMFDLTVYQKDFKLSPFIKKLNNGEVVIDITKLSAYRNVGSLSIGNIIADNLTGWHNPETVNKHFGAFGLNYAFYSNDDCKKLKVLWQLRHSIVHTGGTLTLPDAQKVEELKLFGNKQIAFEKNFIYEVSRKLHPIVKKSTNGISLAFKNNLLPDLEQDTKNKIDKFFEVKSSISVWLK